MSGRITYVDRSEIRPGKLEELRTAIEIFGSPPSQVVEQLRQKAEMLGDAKVLIHEPQVGFARTPVT